MKLCHYSPEPFVLQPRAYDNSEAATGLLKPRGLWVSDDACEDNWRAWCEGEAFRVVALAHCTPVDLRPQAKILRLSSAAEIDDFERSFAVPLYPGGRLSGVDWARVSAEWQGIVISPYIWSRRFSAGIWYYGWDCASGCIWDLSAIRNWHAADTDTGSDRASD